MKLPRIIYVFVEGEGSDACLIAVEDIAEIPEDKHGALVGAYTMNYSSKLEVTKELAE